MSTKRKIVVMEAITLVILLILAGLVHIDNVSVAENYVRSEYMKVYADIVEIKHEDANVKYHYDYSDGNTKVISERTPEICKIVLKYKDITQEYDSISVYNKCKGKDKVKVQICILDYGDRTESKITDVY